MGEGIKDRYFFVANHSPATDDTIILLTTSTQVEKRRARHGARASLVLVTLEPSEYAELATTSVIDCDCALIKRPRDKFETQALAREYKPLPRLPDPVIGRIRAAVAGARTLSAVEKRLVLGPEPDGD